MGTLFIVHEGWVGVIVFSLHMLHRFLAAEVLTGKARMIPNPVLRSQPFFALRILGSLPTSMMQRRTPYFVRNEGWRHWLI